MIGVFKRRKRTTTFKSRKTVPSRSSANYLIYASHLLAAADSIPWGKPPFTSSHCRAIGRFCQLFKQETDLSPLEGADPTRNG